MPVQIEAVKSVPLRDASEYVGVLRSRQSVQIQPLVEGHVSKILVTSGNEVQPGVPLIDIDPSRQRAAVSSQQALHQANVAGLDLARKQYARIERLFNKGAATRQDFDQA
jgi:multidrug efflux pump subunit AcrA (membrane-fusion protein)